ncbi:MULTISPECIES: nitrous oxide reductase accessory protein NosL [Haloferax]|uniref:Nitrous oxide reductase accessory protein NosL n=1 Tax=Haloferax marinum TaxID=2666143 RepID=A0A6A8GA30_9EURY|nr:MULTISPECIES: nitrous oxide reductase accessory protein NosL [Haloferax]KAB1191181.1 nitrous oxide reductase accessory protein NosL [Haloferax sp. CBA1150]MRW98069.1 nitrous oxide reductase accessory protein NosL [Haloferax marinum]
MDDELPDCSPPTDSITRRTALKAAVGSVPVVLAGCLGGNSEPKPEPIDLSGGKEDDQGGMVIGNHAGPNGQIFYRNESPDGHDNPAWFHTLSMGMFPYYFEHERMGWEATAIYVTDYSNVEFTLSSDGGRQFISTHTTADTFGDATELTYVVGSSVYGGMGPDLLPFSDTADADSFVDEHGGSTVEFSDVTSEWLNGYLRS